MPNTENVPKLKPSFNNDDEIDLWELATTIWKRKKLIISITLSLTILTCIYIKLKPNLYEAQATILPIQNGNNKISGAAGALAMFTGAKLPAGNNDANIELILNSRTFKEALIKKYNLMPKLFKPEQLNDVEPPLISYEGVKALNDIISLSTDKKEGILTIKVLTEDPKFSLTLANHIISTLREFIKNNVYTSSKRYRQLVDLRLKKVKQELENIKNINNEEFSMLLQTKQDAYVNLFKAQEQAKLDEIKNTVHFEVIDPAILPLKHAKPKRALIAIVAFVTSFILSVFVVFLLEAINNHKHNNVTS